MNPLSQLYCLRSLGSTLLASPFSTWILRTLVLSAMLSPVATLAHKPSDSYLQVEIRRAKLEVQWDIALRDLDFAIGLDQNGDGSITWGELKSRRQAILEFVLPHLRLNGEPASVELSPTSFLVDNHSDGAYVVIGLEMNHPIALKPFQITYDLFFDFDAQHRGILKFNAGSGTQVHIFTPENQSMLIDPNDARAAFQFLSLAKQGVVHIWIGFDHILFLVALLFPAVLQFQNGSWRVASSFSSVLLQVTKVVSAFTVAHSITLALSALGLVHLPSRWVESTIALSVILAALNNIYPIFHQKTWVVAFVFGLVHGFGFANVFADLGLKAAHLIFPLFAFNLGVEVGQLSIVLLFLPAAFLFRASRFYETCVLRGGSATIAGVACAWMLERVFDFKVLPF